MVAGVPGGTGILVATIRLSDVDLAADNGLEVRLFGVIVEHQGAVEVAVIGNGRGRTAEGTGGLDQIADADGPVQEAVLGMTVQVNEIGHGQAVIARGGVGEKPPATKGFALLNLNHARMLARNHAGAAKGLWPRRRINSNFAVQGCCPRDRADTGKRGAQRPGRRGSRARPRPNHRRPGPPPPWSPHRPPKTRDGPSPAYSAPCSADRPGHHRRKSPGSDQWSRGRADADACRSDGHLPDRWRHRATDRPDRARAARGCTPAPGYKTKTRPASPGR